MQNICFSTVWKILHDLLYPYHIQRILALLPADYPSRVIFDQWYLQQCSFPNFEVSLLFTDEANFSHDAIINHGLMYGLALLEISYLGRFFFHLYLPVTTKHNFWKRNSLYFVIRRRSSIDTQSNVVHARWSSSTFQSHCSRVSE